MSAKKTNILLVEDDAQLLTLLAAILTRSGYSVRTAEDGFAALAEIRAHMPDIILSDLYMLGMSGFELLSVIRRRFPTLPVVAMSSAFSGGDIPTGVAADAFYQKATSIVSLLRIVEETYRPDAALTRRHGEPVPIWIATHSPADAVHQHVVIACPECLRTSTHASVKSFTVVREADCAFCSTPIHYAMVQSVDPGPGNGSPNGLPRRAHPLDPVPTFAQQPTE